jgi:hypothetical protein
MHSDAIASVVVGVDRAKARHSENCGMLNTVITEASCTRTPSPLLKLLIVEAASRSRPPFEFTDTPLMGLPEALMVPPKETR